MRLNDREFELLAGMIEVQQHHKDRCDAHVVSGNANPMFVKQSIWDQERIDLLNKLMEI